MGQVQSREKSFPTELGSVDLFLDVTGSFLVEARSSIGADEPIVRNFLVQAGVEFFF